MNTATTGERRMTTTHTLDERLVRQASLTLAGHATGTDELAAWLDMLGLPPYVRDLRTSPYCATRIVSGQETTP